MLARLAVLGLAVALCVATSPARRARMYPAWRVMSEGARALPCGTAQVWVVKSAKTGVGIVFAVQGRGTPCEVRVARAELRVGGQAGTVVSEATPVIRVESSEDAQAYLPFLFDAEGAWNRGERDARLVLDLEVAGGRTTWDVSLHHALDARHLGGSR